MAQDGQALHGPVPARPVLARPVHEEESDENHRSTRPRRPRRLFVGLSLVLLLIAALFLPPLINISRYQRQIAASLAASLGHPVEISGVKLQLLPRPGVQIADFTVDSVSGFSAEPILQCSSVTAAFRIMSLWRGRLEIARISLDEPSLNLERSPTGQWNFASVLVQASRTPQAPTAGQPAGGQRRFPYIEATNARVNFKHGNEKLPFSFLNADVSVWLENPDEWQLRFAAQPMRTDINLSVADTGLVQVSGSVHRASSAYQLPLDLHAEWRKAPLGQLTRMLLAQDLGWRGDTSVTAHITGIPDALGLNIAATASDFHRETFQPAHSMNLHVTCTATYRHSQGSLDGIDCLSPVGDGKLDLTGSWQQMHTAAPLPDLKLVATHVPAGAALELLRHTRGRLNDDITLSGTIDGEMSYARQVRADRTHSTTTGSFTATDLLLRGDDAEQILPDLHFIVQPSRPLALVLETAQLDLGAPQPLLADARLTRQGYLIRYNGSAELEHLLPLAHAFNVLPVAFQGMQGTGTADYNLAVQGDWLSPLGYAEQPSGDQIYEDQPAPSSTVSGSLVLHNADLQPAYLAEPVHIATAAATVSPAELRWGSITATFGTTHFTGSLNVPVPCGTGCIRHFDLTAATASVGTLAGSMRGDDQGVVQEIISRVRTHSHDWPLLEGSLHVGRLTMGQVEIAGVATNLTLADGKLQVHALDGRTLGGVLHASGTVNLDSTPAYDAQMQLSRASAPELSQLLKERWGPGLLDISGNLTMNGTSASNLSSSAKGTLQWEWTNGALPQLAGSPLRHFDRWTGEGKVAKGLLTITNSEVVSSGASAVVQGTIGNDRSLDLKIGGATTDTAAASPGTTSTTTATLTGTLAAPVVETR